MRGEQTVDWLAGVMEEEYFGIGVGEGICVVGAGTYMCTLLFEGSFERSDDSGATPRSSTRTAGRSYQQPSTVRRGCSRESIVNPLIADRAKADKPERQIDKVQI